MKWLQWKRALLALLCSGFLCDAGCPSDTAVQTAASNAGQTFANSLISPVIKQLVNGVFGTNI